MLDHNIFQENLVGLCDPLRTVTYCCKQFGTVNTVGAIENKLENVVDENGK